MSVHRKPEETKVEGGATSDRTQKAAGERSDQVAQVVEWLRTVYAHFGDWSTKPAPLHFEGALKEYLPDYDLDEEEDDSEDDDESA